MKKWRVEEGRRWKTGTEEQSLGKNVTDDEAGRKGHYNIREEFYFILLSKFTVQMLC